MTRFLKLSSIPLLSVFLLSANVLGQKGPSKTTTLTLKEFISLTASNDTEFEEILVAGLALRYRKDLSLPARDIVFSAKEELSLYLNRAEEDAATTLSLSKLFPRTGTEISTEYGFSPVRKSISSSSDFSFTVAQDIAENAFGRGTRLLDRIIGLEVDVARHQIIEAYEDYLAKTVTLYLDWYEAYENLNVGDFSYQENLKLLDNIEARKKSKIAKSIDVNKIRLQVFAKKERLVNLEERYRTRLNLIEEAVRREDGETLVPQAPSAPPESIGTFEKNYASFRSDSRTYRILRMLDDKSDLEVAKNADDLLPSIRLLAEYKRFGSQTGLESPDDRFMAGLSVEFPFSDQVAKARHETSKIESRKTQLASGNTHHRLHAQIQNLHQEIERERTLMQISEEKIKLARSILKDETENYTFAKVTLNDYISAVNVLDSNRFSLIRHELLWRKLNIEWLRISDRLVDESDVRKRHRGTVGWPPGPASVR